MIKQIRLLLAYMLMLASCNRSTLMHSYQPMNNNCWDRTDTITFDFPPMTTDDKCNLIIGLRVTNHFPYELLILELEQDYQNPIGHRIDTIRYQLTDKSGDFKEKGINYFQFETQSLPLYLKKGQSGKIKIRHLMHKEVLPGIMDVGIHIIH